MMLALTIGVDQRRDAVAVGELEARAVARPGAARSRDGLRASRTESGVFEPPAGKRLPRPSGQPARMMPAPRERPSGDSLGGMNRGGASGFGLRVDVGAGVNEHARSLEVALARRDHERRLAEVLVARIDGGAVLEQRLRDLGVADARREHQRRLAGAIGRARRRRRRRASGASAPRRRPRSPECSGRTP